MTLDLYPVIHLGEVASTMDAARERLAAGEPAPFWVVAESQIGGRGRHGRQWVSPPGNLYATLALCEPCDPARGPELGFVAGLALHQAVAETTGLSHPALAIKWPNDLLLDGAKLAGILLEGITLAGRFHVLIGIGVNVAHAPEGTPYPARALSQGPDEALRSALFEALRRAWASSEAQWRAGFGETRSAWLARAAHLGKPARVRLPAGEMAGVMRGIDAHGRLLLDVEGVERVIEAGDVFL